MLSQLSATRVTCSVRVGAVIVQLLPEFAPPSEDSGNYSLGLSRIRWGCRSDTSRHISFRIRGKVDSSCVRSRMLHGNETWGPNVSDLQRLKRNDRAMIRWICGVKPGVHDPSALLDKLLV